MKTVKTRKTTSTKTAPKTAPVKTAASKAPATKVATASADRKRNVSPAAPTKAANQRGMTPSQEITTELIAARAYVIWEQQGRPHGRDVANWLLAESQLKQEQSFTA